MSKKQENVIKVAISQRIIPHYRVPVFAELARRENIQLTVFYGRGFKQGSQTNATNIKKIKAVKLVTVLLIFKRGGMKHLRVWHPSLLLHLIWGGYNVVVVEPSTNIYNNLFSFLYCKIFRKKFIWYDAGSEPIEKRTRQRKLIEPLVKLFIKYADAFITYTSYADKSLKEYYEISENKIFRAQNTVDTSHYDSLINESENKVEEIKKKYGLNEYKVCLYIGGLEKRKKINLLISAVEKINRSGIKTKALIVGDGADKAWIENEMNAYEKESTIFAGKHVDDAIYYILASDIVVLPSEGGLSVTQAFACRKPFIGSEEIEHGGIRDYVQDGYNGYLFKEGDIKQLTDIIKMVFTNEKLYDKLCEGAYATSKRINIKHMVDGIENAIKYSINE